MKSNRIIEIDILRMMAISLIVISHLRFAIPQFYYSGVIQTISTDIAIYSLALFFFLSGYSLMINKPNFYSFYDIKNYLSKRVIRIYPLYLLALAIYYVATAYIPQYFGLWYLAVNNNGLQLLINITGLQALFENIFSNQSIEIFWFVGAILLYYMCFPIIILFANGIRKVFTQSVLLVSGIIFILIIVAGCFTKSVDPRIVYYYWFFIAGIMVGKGTNLANINSLKRTKLAFLLTCELLLITLISKIYGEDFGPFEQLILQNISNFMFSLAIGMAGIILSILLVNASKKYIVGRFYAIIQRIALSTYPIYLFHQYFLLMVTSLTTAWLGITFVPFLVVLFGIPMALLIPPYIQDCTNAVISKVRVRLSASKTSI